MWISATVRATVPATVPATLSAIATRATWQVHPTNENASSRQSMCIYYTSTGGGFAAPWVAKLDGVVKDSSPETSTTHL
jgi:hypothetical protein